MEKFWREALKRKQTGATVGAFIFWALIVLFFQETEFVSKNPWIVLVLLILTFNISVSLINKTDKKINRIIDNNISGNKVKGNLELSTEGEISSNKITKNEIDGGLTIKGNDKK